MMFNMQDFFEIGSGEKKRKLKNRKKGADGNIYLSSGIINFRNLLPAFERDF